MIVETDSAPFSDYTKIYTNSSQFPQEALDFIPDNLIDVIDNGNASFFKHFEPSLPCLYNILTNVCSPIVLLESRFAGFGIGETDSENFMYWWGLTCRDLEVIVGIPLKQESSQYQSLLSKKIAILPSLFHCCYDKMDGLAIVEGVGSTGFDLPSTDSEWRRIDDHCIDFEIDIPKNWTTDYFGHSDIRVFIRGSKGHLFLIDCLKKPSPIYCVTDLNFNNIKQIDNLVDMDRYFANAVLGFPNGEVHI